VTVGLAGYELRRRRPTSRTFAVTANAMSVIFYGFTLLSVGNFEHPDYVTQCFTGVIVMVGLAVSSAILLSTPSARLAFTVPTR
ncbi:MAG: hypothetical protein ACRD0P_30200, partial [Stackebrandtia sp.]